MAENSSQVSSVNEPDPKKPKLDHGDKEEAETLESDESDFEAMIEASKLCPRHFESGEESGELVELCKLALAHYQNKHPGESYEFESGQGGFQWFNFRHTEYRLEFLAKNLRKNGNLLQNFEARVDYHPYDGPEEFVVEECHLLKDDEVEPKFPLDFMLKTPLEDLEENESAKIVEFCKSILAFYKEKHPEESYEFVKIQKLKRWISKGVQYILVFEAKNLKVDTLATFKASAYNLKRVIDIATCELRFDVLHR